MSVPYRPPRLPLDEMLARATGLHAELEARRSVRQYSDEPVPRELIELAIRTASSAPSGANLQPWTFVAIGDVELKRRVRDAAEQEERRTYEERMSAEWREALAPLGTGWRKPFLTVAPWLVVLLAQRHGRHPDGRVRKHYYVTESVGMAAGLFVSAVHHMGLATVPYTPAPMTFLARLLDRPDNERPFALFPVGYPAPDAEVPDIERKPLDEVAVWFPGRVH